MNSVVKWIEVALFASLLLMAESSPAVAGCSHALQVGYNNWPPYSWEDEDGNARGLDVDLLNLFAKQAGCELVFRQMPPRRSHQLMRAGKIDIMMGASKTEQRLDYAFFSEPYRLEVVNLFSVEGVNVTDISAWPELLSRQYKLLVPQVGWYGEEFERSKSNLKRQELLVESPDLLRSVQMLSRGRANIAIGDSLAFPFIAGQSEQIHLYRHSVTLNENDIHLMFSRESMSIEEVDAFNRAIDQSGKDGEIARLQLKWEQISLSKNRLLPSQSGSRNKHEGSVLAE
ncbi:substrate-binding periplasmic protein [Shewanella sp.]|uniref:substrate-binding periplasmic protein n=1 Tax=Shewanella sp. TaxID=50422 RepID=UPI00356957AF